MAVAVITASPALSSGLCLCLETPQELHNQAGPQREPGASMKGAQRPRHQSSDQEGPWLMCVAAASLALTPEVTWKAREQVPYAFCSVAGVRRGEHYQVATVSGTQLHRSREGAEVGRRGQASSSNLS